ncbi:MAG: helix-turn-helix transcriptional regulator [Gemmatimonadetes bacterium]|nr:helix-turn-helix transcriptional regulator [Gemmatimonadota bacterium]
MEQFGKNLRAQRKERRMTQTELANLVGVAPAYVSQIESSLRMPSLKVARRFAESLGVELPVLLGTAESDHRGLSDPEKIEMLRQVARAIERDLDRKEDLELTEEYPGSHGSTIARDSENEVRVYRFTGAPKTEGREALFTHPGEETLYCAAGELSVREEDQVFTLRAGQTRVIDGSVGHIVHGSEGAVLVSTVTPALASRDVRRVPSGKESRLAAASHA